MGDYPGAEYQMSLYGLREKNPAETAGQWKEWIKTENRLHNNHISIRGDGTSMWPEADRPVLQQMSYFDNIKQVDTSCSPYDRMFHVDDDYNSRLHRDDRQHTVGLDIQAEERARAVPVRASTEYGRRVQAPLEDASERTHVRIDKVMKGFYRSRGTGIPTAASIREQHLTLDPADHR